MFDGTHSLSWLALVAAFFGFAAPFFGAISQIWLGFGGKGKCGCGFGDAGVEEEDEVEKVGTGYVAALL